MVSADQQSNNNQGKEKYMRLVYKPNYINSLRLIQSTTIIHLYYYNPSEYILLSITISMSSVDITHTHLSYIASIKRKMEL